VVEEQITSGTLGKRWFFHPAEGEVKGKGKKGKGKAYLKGKRGRVERQVKR